MKRSKLITSILVIILALAMTVALTGCENEIGDAENGAPVAGIAPPLAAGEEVEIDLSNQDLSDAQVAAKIESGEIPANVTHLNLHYNNLTDSSLLSGLTNLRNLDLGGNSVSDISGLSTLVNLTELDLWRNGISDISALSTLTNLERLRLQNNSISDASVLSGLTNLTWADLFLNHVTDWSPTDHIDYVQGRP